MIRVLNFILKFIVIFFFTGFILNFGSFSINIFVVVGFISLIFKFIDSNKFFKVVGSSDF
ncbi:hypothetical protein [Candidatus Arthromitus sp. SFB-turkey]|uniref:hypothetical protein n=1 Tax=Candidatus Arthromitus sp. SFB-turkey TaxID=1840217 RepID=UPI0007F334F8|nr:hypothetical protein [Candidatus Arthromitus sp. SFB-turkey]OAT88792.1 hypothetical protein A6P36_07045 [Candidatus Arthromitus sp. SFB-turkey]HJD00851.1 hypothetical protein [Candidatus Dwaynia gallinarum]